MIQYYPCQQKWERKRSTTIARLCVGREMKILDFINMNILEGLWRRTRHNCFPPFSFTCLALLWKKKKIYIYNDQVHSIYVTMCTWRSRLKGNMKSMVEHVDRNRILCWSLFIRFQRFKCFGFGLVFRLEKWLNGRINHVV